LAEGESPISSWIQLRPGVPQKLHFVSHAHVSKLIRDPILGVDKTVPSIVFLVDFQNGKRVEKNFSVVSQRLAAELSPYLVGRKYEDLLLTVVKPAGRMAAPRLSRTEPWIPPRD